MTWIDWSLLAGYMVLSLLAGLWWARRQQSEADYFLAGRRLTGWLAGASMAATTFSADTPLYVAGLVATRGIAGNWEWWGFGLAHVAMTVIFAPLWRRSGVLTDAALTELRYGGQAAAWLRGIKAFLFAVPVNCIGMGYALLATAKVSEALGLAQTRSEQAWLLGGIALLVLVYTAIGGLWAVVITDVLQLLLAFLGAIAVAVAAISACGGIEGLLLQLEQLGQTDLLRPLPMTLGQGGIQWLEGSGITVSMFLAYITLQWWSFRRSDGGGEFIQRLLATRDEQEARRAGWVFLVLNYVLRSWPWILVALAAVVLLPAGSDWEQSYPRLAVELLPPGILGLVVVSLMAAFMSTVSTSVNWGSSYVTNDLYKRFFRPDATQRELVVAGQLMSALLLACGVLAALMSTSVGSVFRLVIAIGTGPGVVLVLRWFWWRINAASELAAMVAGLCVGLATTLLPNVRIEDYGLRLFATTGITAVVWIAVLVATPPESPEVLQRFVVQVRPAGPGWSQWRQRFGVTAPEPLTRTLMQFVWGSVVLFGATLAVGGWLLHQQGWAWICTAVTAIGLWGLRRSWRGAGHQGA